jgi:hypothetical protein
MISLNRRFLSFRNPQQNTKHFQSLGSRKTISCTRNNAGMVKEDFCDELKFLRSTAEHLKLQKIEADEGTKTVPAVLRGW